MKCLVTGGAGFIGRWVVSELLSSGHEVLALDDLSNGRRENLAEFDSNPLFKGLLEADLTDDKVLREVFDRDEWDVVFHLGASIHVQKSIDNPEPTFRNDALGTFRVLEESRRQYFRRNGLDIDAGAFDYDRDVPKLKVRSPRVAVMSTCMVYDAVASERISEKHPYRPASPYAAAKIGADMLALSFHASYKMPVTVVRPFNTFGPFQKSNSEGGVVSIFLKRDIEGSPLLVKGSGEQTRDLLYVADCAAFVVKCAMATQAEGQIINAGTGSDVSVKDLARLCASGSNEIKHVAHDHPQAEIMRLCCDSTLAEKLLGWQAATSLQQGIAATRTWLENNRWAW